MAFVQDPADASVQFVVEQTGRIRVIRNGVLQTTPFLDLSASITAGGEQGLLGMALPADTATSRRVFVYFNNPAGDIVVARFKRSASSSPLTADPQSRFDLRWSTGEDFIRHPVHGNHNGGMIAFGPDGYLYLGVGDGGSGNDPAHNAQNMAVLLGKILRIDVSVADSHGAGFSIPPDNPFPSGTRPEIWDIGLRNPWKFSFDDPARGGTGALVIGDVGQGAWEEVDYEPAGRGGVNYGWRNREGAHNNVTSLPPAFQPLTDPIFEYSRPTGFSITGGYVYRGVSLGASYRGRYFFADFVAAKIWSIALSVDPSSGAATASDLRNHTTELGSHAVSGFGVDAAGELYVLDYRAGSVLRVGAIPSSVAPLMSIDLPSHGQDVSPPFVVAGWALDPLATADPGIDAIHVWAYPIPAIGSPTTGSPVFVGATGLGVQRPDVAHAFGGSHFTGSGFGLFARGLAPGTYRLVVFGLVRATGTFGVARAVDVRALSGVLVAIDVPGSAIADRPFVVGGWAIDLAAASGNGIDAIHVWGVNAAQPGTFVFLGAAPSFGDRPDVANVFGPQFTTSGYTILVHPPSAGVWDLFVFPRNATTGQFEAARTRRVTVR